MELRHIRIAVTLAEELHYGRTAKRLRIAQSAVTQAVQALEAELSAVLFERTRRRVALSNAGQKLVEYGRRALEELDRGRDATKRAAAGHSGTLSVRFTPVSVLTRLPHTVVAFKRDHPEVHVTVEPAGIGLDGLRGGACDVLFTPACNDIAPLTALALERYELVVVVPDGHRLAKRRSVQLAELAREPFVFIRRATEPDISVLFTRRCAEAGFTPEVVLHATTTEVLLAFVAAGLGISVMPSLMTRLGFPGLKAVPLRPALNGAVGAVWNPERLTPVAARFLEWLRAAKH